MTVEFNDGTFIESNDPTCNTKPNADWPRSRNTPHTALMILQHILEQETNEKPDP